MLHIPVRANWESVFPSACPFFENLSLFHPSLGLASFLLGWEETVRPMHILLPERERLECFGACVCHLDLVTSPNYEVSLPLE